MAHAGAPERDLFGDKLPGVVVERQARGALSTTFESETGLILQVVANHARAMAVLLADAGGHAIDPSATGSSSGYLLDNGQEDEYPDCDAVPLARALVLVEEIGLSGAPPAEGWLLNCSSPTSLPTAR